MKVKGFMNVYRSGHFHRAGKADCYDRHAGDIYPTREAAVRDIDPPSHYIDTIEIAWEEKKLPNINGSDSVPVPLNKTRSGEYVVD